MAIKLSSLLQYSCVRAYIYRNIAVLVDGDQTVHEDSNNVTCYNTSISFHKKLAKPKLIHVRVENSW